MRICAAQHSAHWPSQALEMWQVQLKSSIFALILIMLISHVLRGLPLEVNAISNQDVSIAQAPAGVNWSGHGVRSGQESDIGVQGGFRLGHPLQPRAHTRAGGGAESQEGSRASSRENWPIAPTRAGLAETVRGRSPPPAALTAFTDAAPQTPQAPLVPTLLPSTCSRFPAGFSTAGAKAALPHVSP